MTVACIMCGCVDELVSTDDDEEIKGPDDEEQIDPEPEETWPLTGKVQKGPFALGGGVTAYLLDENLSQTGISYTAKISAADGSYTFEKEIESRFVEVSATGYWFNESKGELSASTITLNAIADLSESGTVNINVLTTLASDMIRNAVKDGRDYAEAKADSETATLAVFHITENHPDFQSIDLTQEGTGAAILLSASSTLITGRQESEVVSLMATIAAELASSGEVSESTASKISEGASEVDAEAVRANLLSYYAQEGLADAVVPEFEGWLDTNGNGILDKDESWLILGEKELWISDEGGELQVELQYNVDCEVVIDDEAASWITVSPAARGFLKTSIINLTVAPNEEYDERVGTVTVREIDGTQEEKLIVVQKQKDAVTVTSDSYEVEPEGGVIDIEVKANVQFDYHISDDSSDWIRPAPQTKGLESTHLQFTVDRSYEPELRTGEIIFTSGDLTETVTVYQAGEKTLILNQDEYMVSDEGGTIEVLVSSNCEDLAWRFTGDVDWISELRTRSYDLHRLSFAVMPNHTYGAREARIEIYDRSGGVSETVTVYQVQNDALMLAKDSYTFDNSGGRFSVEVQHNVPVEVEIPDSCSWISRIQTKALQTSVMDFAVAANEAYDSRSGIVIFHGSDLSDTVKVYQAQENAIILSDDYVEVPAGGTNFTLQVNSNVDFSVAITEGSDWLRQVRTRSLSTHTLVFAASENSTYDERTGIILISDRESGLRETVTVRQKQKNAIVIGVSEYELSHQGGNVDIKVSSNVDFTYEIETGAEWISELQGTKAMTESIVSFAVAPNESFSEREGTIVFKNESGSLSNTVTIIQDADTDSRTIHVETPGTLSEIIDIEDLRKVRNLTFTGNFNEDDSRYLSISASSLHKEEYKTETLDLTGVTFENNTLVGFNGLPRLRKVKLPTSITAIYRAFDWCTSLAEVDFGETPNLQILGCGIYQSGFYETYVAGAFSGCTSLTSFDVPETVTEIQAGAFYGSGIREINFSPNCRITTFKPTTVYLTNNLGGVYPVDFGIFTGCTELTTIDIPSSVKIIAGGAFAGWSGLESLIIPETVTNIITESLFSNCGNLEYVSLPSCTTDIGASMFSGCSSLSSFDFASGYDSIGEEAFNGCNSLETISLEGVSVIEDGAFSGCGFTSIVIPDFMTEIPDKMFSGCKRLLKVDLNKVQKIGQWAFDSCSALESIDIPNTVVEIRDYAFQNCDNLKEVVFEGGSLRLADRAFDSASLERVYIKKEVASLISLSGSSAIFPKDFNGFVFEEGSRCSEFGVCREMTISDDFVLPPSVKKLSDDAFYGAKISQSTAERLLSGIEEIGFEAFAWTEFSSINIPEGVKKIGGQVFRMNTNLTSFTFPSTLEYIPADIFMGCKNLVTSTLNGGDLVIEGRSQRKIFDSSPFIKEVIIGKDVRSLKCIDDDGELFKGSIMSDGIEKISFEEGSQCVSVEGTIFTGKNIKEVSLPSSLEVIGDYAFNRCELTSLVIPENVKSIGARAFQYCTGLTSLTLPGKLVSIGNYAFNECSSLTSFTIPDSVTSIGDYAFRCCTSLGTLEIPATVSTVGQYITEAASLSRLVINKPYQDFSKSFLCKECVINCAIPEESFKDATFSKVTISEGVTEIGPYAFSGCRRLVSVSLPSTVTTIGESAFSSCSVLTSIDFQNGLTEIGTNAFYSCKAMESISIPEGVKKIGDRAFDKCSALTNVYIPASVTEIGDFVFSSCSSLERIDGPTVAEPDGIHLIVAGMLVGLTPSAEFPSVYTVPSEVTEIKAGVYSGFNYESFTIPSTVKRASAGIFGTSKISSLTIDSQDIISEETFHSSVDHSYSYSPTISTVIIGDNITIIPESAFEDCDVHTLYIGKNVTLIERRAFDDAIRMTIYSKPLLPPTIFDNSFPFGYTETVYVPAASLEAYQEAPFWKSNDIIGYDF